MKIGILTFPFNNNYGGFLQAYALMTVLKSKGHDVWLINRRPNRIMGLPLLFYIFKRIIKKYIFKQKIEIINTNKKSHDDYYIVGKNTLKFVEKYIQPQTKAYYSTKQLAKCKKLNFDAMIVGSDQIWRPKYISNIEDFFLGFLKKNKKCLRISYAASFGVDLCEYDNRQRRRCGELIKQFDDVSVRENSGSCLIEKELKWLLYKPKVVLDPTMLLDIEQYRRLFSSSADRKTKTLFCYILDMSSQVRSIIQIIASTKSLEPYYIMPEFSPWDLCKPVKKRILPSVEVWLKSMYEADFVITDSFHGTVFSILFNRPFLTIGNLTRGISRLSTLLSNFSLENRLILLEDFMCLNFCNENINWKSVNKKIEYLREYSLNFLEQALERK
jgi:hypothetical protein